MLDFVASRYAGQREADEFYKKMDDTMNATPDIARISDVVIRNLIHYGTVPSWTRRFTALPSLQGHNLVWLQLLQVDEQKTAQLKLYALGSRVAMADDDSNVVERSRKLFKDAAPFFMKDSGLWIFSRSLVRKGYNGLIDDAALEFAPYDPLEYLSELPLDPSAGIRCAEIFLFLAIDNDVPGDHLCNREAVKDFLNALNSEDGTRKIHAFTVTAGSVVATREKLQEFRGKHLTA
ncbi:hypothetical protein KSS87_021261 [Heliosperma pusillum]|nr:hypothetical protein KSS87_021261 [Heliosperma pusillum]